MPTPLSLAEHTLLAELLEQSIDAMFDAQFQENGSFIVRPSVNREGVKRGYIYYQGYMPGNKDGAAKTRFSQYVGPADDPQLAARVQRFNEIKAGRRERGSLVSALRGAGLPRPPVMMGRILEALAKAGVFRLRAVLVGTAAYQTYSAVTGMRLSQSAAITGDIDVAQFRSISIGSGDQTPPILETLQTADPTFRPVPHGSDPRQSTVFANATNFRVDFLTAHRGGDEQMGKPMKMAALTGAAAQPLRFMDYLIRNPVRSVVLHGPGISVNVPAPERYALHKLIISGERPADANGRAKSRKDLMQSAEIILALAQSGGEDALSSAFREAWERGPRWRQGLSRGAKGISSEAAAVVKRISDGDVDRGGVMSGKSSAKR